MLARGDSARPTQCPRNGDRRLGGRDLRNVALVISDYHKGFMVAATRILNATLQHCRAHFMGNRRSPSTANSLNYRAVPDDGFRASARYF